MVTLFAVFVVVAGSVLYGTSVILRDC